MFRGLDFTNNVCRAGVWVRKEALFFLVLLEVYFTNCLVWKYNNTINPTFTIKYTVPDKSYRRYICNST